MPRPPGDHTGIALGEELAAVHRLPSTARNLREELAGVGPVIDEVPLNIHEAERRQHLAPQQVGSGGNDLLQRLFDVLGPVCHGYLHAEGRVAGVAVLEVRHEGR